MRTVEELVARAPDRFDITVIGGEPHPSYNRILLSSVLAGERTLAEIVIQPSSWYEKHSIHLIAGNHATAIDPVTRRVALPDGATVPYDKLLLAMPLAPPIPGLDFANVRAFRDIADVEAMIEAARNHRRAVVIGGGLLGLEAAWGLKQRGMSVALVHLMPMLMERQLGECIEHNGQVFGLLAPIWEQAKVCAARLAGDDAAVYVPQRLHLPASRSQASMSSRPERSPQSMTATKRSCCTTPRAEFTRR